MKAELADGASGYEEGESPPVTIDGNITSIIHRLSPEQQEVVRILGISGEDFRAGLGDEQERNIGIAMRSANFHMLQEWGRTDFGDMSVPLTPIQRQVAYDFEEISAPGESPLVITGSPAFQRILRAAPIENIGHLWRLASEAKRRRTEALEDDDLDSNNSLFLVAYEAIGRVVNKKDDGSIASVDKLPDSMGVFESGMMYRALMERKTGIAPEIPSPRPGPISMATPRGETLFEVSNSMLDYQRANERASLAR